MRHPADVARAIKNKIDKEAEVWKDAECILDDLASSMDYAAPELWPHWFGELSRYINYIIPFPPQEEWQWEAVAELTDKTVDELKTEMKERGEI
jgi:hypothetical protein